jgi:hypothetical protein
MSNKQEAKETIDFVLDGVINKRLTKITASKILLSLLEEVKEEIISSEKLNDGLNRLK